MSKFIKVNSYDRVIEKWIPSYVNPEQIQQLVSIPEEDGEMRNLVKFGDMAIRVSNDSYQELIKVLYGKEKENA